MASEPEESRAKAMRAVEAIFERYKLITSSPTFRTPHPLFDEHLMSTLTLLSASAEGTVTFSLLIDERYANINGVMHGGAAGVIFDMCTTMALGPVARPGFWDFLGGVTRALNISYLRAIPIGTTVLISSHVTQYGRTMAMIRGAMTSLDGQTVYCTCEHHKVSVPTRKEHLVHRVGWDELWVEAEEVGKEGSKL